MHIRLMTESDVPAGMSLGKQNGWNQLERDWLRFLAMQPDGCFLAEANGKVAGTACACIFDSVAWVALVLVDSTCRKQGIGRRLMEHVLRFLERNSIPTIRLDATPLGQPIYEKLGFDADYELARYEGVLPIAESANYNSATSASMADLNDICQFDQAITGTNRAKFLHLLFKEDAASFRLLRSEGKIGGFLASRPGARATQVGPCLAHNEANTVLLQDAFQRLAGQLVYIDIPLQNILVQKMAESAGLTVQRRLLRMTRGRRIKEQVANLWASSGPEKG